MAMVLFALVFAVVALVLIGVGFAVGLVGCAVAAVLLGVGVVSSSFVVGILRGRVSDGVRAFLLQCGILAGIPAGAACAWLVQSFFAAYGSGWPVLVYGALGGAFAGLLVAVSLDVISRFVQTWAVAQVGKLRREEAPILAREEIPAAAKSAPRPMYIAR